MKTFATLAVSFALGSLTAYRLFAPFGDPAENTATPALSQNLPADDQAPAMLSARTSETATATTN